MPARSAIDSVAPETASLPREKVREIVERALAEDIGLGDITTRFTVPAGLRAKGTFSAQQDLILAGLCVAEQVFRSLDPECRWEIHKQDGKPVTAGEPMASVEGKAAALLSGERVALNFLQRLSGIATLTRKFKSQLAGLETQLLDTRKTTPGLRVFEKYAVRMGGGHNHRIGLEDGILIKNNHLTLGGGIRAALGAARKQWTSGKMIEVEVRNSAELEQAISGGADVVLLDNMSPEQVAECVKRSTGRALLEVSGGVNLGNIRRYAETGVQRIAVGALTHSAPAVDIHFLLQSLN